MKPNFKTILTSGTLLLGSLALFAGCGNSSSSDNFKANIKKEVNWILNNPNPNQRGHINPNPSFNIGIYVKTAISDYEAYGTAINNYNVNLSVTQVFDYYKYQYKVFDNLYGVVTSVLVNNSKVSKPTKDTFSYDNNFANNFILSFNYLVDKDNKVTQINDATNNDYFNLQNTGNSIDNYAKANGELSSIKVNDKFDIKNPAFDPITTETDNKGALFVDQRTNWVSPIKDNKKSIWSLPNAAYTAAVKSKTIGIKTIKNITDATTLQKVIKSGLEIKIGYTENLTIVSGSNQKGVIYGLNADKLSFNYFFLNYNNIGRLAPIIVIGSIAPWFAGTPDELNTEKIAFWLNNVKFNFSGGPYLGYSVSSIDLMK